MSNSFGSAEIKALPFRSGHGKKRILVRQPFDISVLGTYLVGQLRNH